MPPCYPWYRDVFGTVQLVQAVSAGMCVYVRFPGQPARGGGGGQGGSGSGGGTGGGAGNQYAEEEDDLYS